MSDGSIRAAVIRILGAGFLGLAGFCGILRAGGGEVAPEPPVPYDGATDVDPDGLILYWWAAEGAESYDVYLGVAPDSLLPVGSATQPYWLLNTPLAGGTCYYWQVVARAGSTVLATGPVRRFTTMALASEDAVLLAWYAFDEGAGVISRDLAGGGSDALVEQMTWGGPAAPGVEGASVHSSGQGWVHFQIPAAASPANCLTLTGWFRIQRQNESAALWSLGSGPGSYVSLVCPADGGCPFIEVLAPGQSQPVRGPAPTPLPMDRWTHLAVVMEGPAGRITVHEDGAVVWTVQGLTGLADVVQQAREVFLGASFVSNSRLFGGMDDARLYAGSLDGREIARTMLGHPDSPYEPSPRHWAQVHVTVPAVLRWQGTPAAVTYDLYTGAAADHLDLVASGLTRTEYSLKQPPAGGQTLYWRVHAVLGEDLISGPLWQFFVTNQSLGDVLVGQTDWWADFTEFYRQIVPDVSLTDIDGVGHRLRDYRGRHLLVVVWAPWCSVSRAEMTELSSLRKAMSEDELALLTITDETNEDILPGFLAGRPDITFPVCVTKTSLLPAPLSSVSHFPSIFYLAPDGLVKLGTVGRVPQATIKAILASAWPRQ